jgi:hypothetical protein
MNIVTIVHLIKKSQGVEEFSGYTNVMVMKFKNLIYK